MGSLDSWNEETIKKRGERLAGHALMIWAAPKLSPEVLALWQVKPTNGPKKYSINNHPNLLTPYMQDLYQAFRKEVLSLDPCVTEEFLKFYVAYKAETNFVDIIPLTKFMRLMLNMPFADIKDPKGICRDVTGLGRWGNGDIELELRTIDELPYIMSLVRQSFESQMNDEK